MTDDRHPVNTDRRTLLRSLGAGMAATAVPGAWADGGLHRTTASSPAAPAAAPVDAALFPLAFVELHRDA